MAHPSMRLILKGCLSNSASTLPNRPFSCYPLQHHIRDCPRILFPNAYSSVSASFMNQGITSEGQKGPFSVKPHRVPVSYRSKGTFDVLLTNPALILHFIFL
ncbi:unnamed protein product [Musa hybrid cultivar]